MYHIGGRERTLRVACLLILLPLITAGCLGGKPQESGNPTPTPTPWNNSAVDGIAIDYLRVDSNTTPEGPLREDDWGVIRYGISHAGTTNDSIARFVTFSVDGAIVSVENINLQPGESREYEHALGSLRGRAQVKAEVRVAAARMSLDEPVVDWPRTGEWVTMGNLSVRVNRWLKNLEEWGVDVNLTIRRPASAVEDVTGFRAKVLCASHDGSVTMDGDARADPPEAGASGTFDVRLPGCPETLYGIRLKFEESAESVEERILFVERGWRPPSNRP